MTVLDSKPRTAINARKFVLATDLDGTFLGGSDADRATLYQWIEANRDTIGLIFVTGRDPAFIRELCDNGVPWPEYVIGDVGTSIARVDGDQIDPILVLEEEIADTWANGGDRVRAALDGVPGLTLQPTAFRYRVSYNLVPDRFDAGTLDKIRDMGFDPLISDNRFFDVLPRGVSKGPSLIRLVDHLGIAPDSVLAAGDTMNDLSMLECGLPAVAVGGSEPDLISRVDALSHVHKATGIGAAGIIEAVARKNLHTPPKGD